MPLLSLSHPWYLLLAPLLIGGAIYVARHGLADLSASRARWSLGLRIAILLCGVLALSGLQVRQPTRKLSVLFVVDLSDSIPPAQKKQELDYINEAARKMGPNDEGGVLVFGSDAYLELEPKAALSLTQIHSRPPRDYSNLAGALRLALASLPEDAEKRVVVLSDGNENLGSAAQEAATAASAGVEVDAVPIQYRYDHEVLLEKMVLPGEAKVGEPFDVRIIARSTEKQAAVIRLLRNGELIAQQTVNLLAGPNVINFHQSLERARFYSYEAVIEAAHDQLPDNNRALGFVLVKGKPRVLIVENNAGDARYLAAVLQGQKLEVDVREPGRLPTSLAEFQTYDSVVLSNVGADRLTPDQMKAIRSSVRDLGCGLVMIGGENSFGPGAYRGTPIEEALPVDMEVKKHKVMPVGAVAMVLHTCEFPDGNRWARETAAAVVDVLGERDKVGVLLFDTGERWGIPLQAAANKEKIKSQLYNLDPGDMPDFHSIMKMAYEGLQTDAREAAVKHIIVISDGDPQGPSPELMAQIQKAKITVSTVAVFPHGGGTGTLEGMARDGRGEFYNVKNPNEIPRIFLKEAQRVLKPAIIEETFQPNLLPGSQLLSGINRTPPLMGYVATTPKSAPSVEVAMTSRHDDPILVSWRYGLGKSVAFTSDAKNRWAAPWIASGSTFARFWAQAIRWTVRSTARSDLDTQVEINQRKGKVVVDVVDSKGNFINNLDIRGSVAGERVSPKLRIDQTAPGRYEGEFDAPDKGQYMVALHYTDSAGIPRIHTVGAAVSYSPEYRDLTANTAVLSSLTDRTGGKLLGTLSDRPRDADSRAVWRHDRRSHSAPQDLWPALLVLSAFLLPADVGVRRLMVSRREWAGFSEAIYSASLGKLIGPRREGERVEATHRLLTAKARASRRAGGEDEPGDVRGATPEAAPDGPEAERPRYAGPERRLPNRPGGRTVTPQPGASREAETRPELRMTSPEGPPQPTARAPEPESKPSPSAQPAPPSPPEVVWNRPAPGAGPGSPPSPAASAPKPDAAPPEPGGDEADSTSRLLRAKRRAQRDQRDQGE